MGSQPRLVEVRKNVLKQNDLTAHALREQFRTAGVYVVSLVSSPGSGKTLLLEKTLTLLRQSYRVAALVGDLATENDAVRLARSQEAGFTALGILHEYLKQATSSFSGERISR